ncbi:MAG TPA: hypothetical protein VFL79_13510 [Terriglobia bacterium]|nr:hypothetical protein [Terriglobia bacterium]
MKSLKLATAVAIFLVLGSVQGSNLAAQSVPANAGFASLKSLAGVWEGTVNEGGKVLPVSTSFRLVSDGSALMNDLMSGTPHEMITMFHLDGGELMATHYCAAHNQPRFLMAPSADPRVVDFEFKDATNLSSPTAPHMVRVRFTFVNANHHVEDWTFLSSGQTTTRHFDFYRKS